MNPHRLGSGVLCLMAIGWILRTMWLLLPPLSAALDSASPSAELWDLVPWTFPAAFGLGVLVWRSSICTALFGDRDEVSVPFPEAAVFWRGMLGVLGVLLIASHAPNFVLGERGLPYFLRGFLGESTSTFKVHTSADIVMILVGLLLIVEGGRVARFWFPPSEEES